MLQKEKNGTKKIDIGLAVRTRRNQLNLTLKQISERTNLSAGFISQLERNLTKPSLVSLANIAEALEVSISYFLNTPKGADIITHETSRKYFSVNGSPMQYARLSQEFPGNQINGVICQIPPGYVSEKVAHSGEDFIYAISGSGFIRIEDEEYPLEPGDSCHFQSTTQHCYGNHGEETCIWLYICTKPLFNSIK